MRPIKSFFFISKLYICCHYIYLCEELVWCIELLCKMSLSCLFISRSWVKSLLSPSTRPTVAMSTWAKTRWTVRSSAPRAPRWTSWCPTTTENMWVSLKSQEWLSSARLWKIHFKMYTDSCVSDSLADGAPCSRAVQNHLGRPEARYHSNRDRWIEGQRKKWPPLFDNIPTTTTPLFANAFLTDRPPHQLTLTL